MSWLDRWAIIVNSADQEECDALMAQLDELENLPTLPTAPDAPPKEKHAPPRRQHHGR